MILAESFFGTIKNSLMALEPLDANALLTTSGLYCDCGYWSDGASNSTTELNRCDYNPSSPQLTRSVSASTFSQYSASPLRARSVGKKRMIMDDADKGIYNSLGSSSSPSGKPTYNELGLWKGWRKHGAMWKTGPNPCWYSWKKRFFVLKGNFLYYFAPCRHLKDAPVLGAIYLRNAIIEKTSMKLAKRVLRISPPVPRRRGQKDMGDDSSTFHIKFKSDSERDEWYEVLQNVAFENEFPEEKVPLIDSSMQYVTSYRQ